jgi:hypothetical protein
MTLPMIRTLVLLFASPALAADPGLAMLAARIDAAGSAGLAAAYAACLAGQGDIDRTAAFFMPHGWTRHQDSETGQVELLSGTAPYRVTLYVDTRRCEVGSDALGEQDAHVALRALANALGEPLAVGESQPGCEAAALGTAQVQIAVRGERCATTAATAAIFRFPEVPDA